MGYTNCGWCKVAIFGIIDWERSRKRIAGFTRFGMHHAAWLYVTGYDGAWLLPTYGTKQASSDCWRKVDGSWGAEPFWGMCDIHSVRLHVRQRFVADDFGEISTQGRYSVTPVPQDTACAESKPATTRSWGYRGSGVIYLRTNRFACCLALYTRPGSLGWRSSVAWDYRNDRNQGLISCHPAFAWQPSQFLFCQRFRSEPGRCPIAKRPSKLDFWTGLQSESGQRFMASRPSKPDFWSRLQSEPGQRFMAGTPSKLDVWKSFRSEPGQRDMAIRPAKFDFGLQLQSEPRCSFMACRPSKIGFWKTVQ